MSWFLSKNWSKKGREGQQKASDEARFFHFKSHFLASEGRKKSQNRGSKAALGGQFGGAFFSLSNLDECRFYEVRAAAFCPQNEGDWSEILTFQTPCVVASKSLDRGGERLFIFPNPADENVFFQLEKYFFDQCFDIEMLDATGRTAVKKAHQKAESGLFEIKTDDLAAGIFQIILTLENGRKLVGRLAVVR